MSVQIVPSTADVTMTVTSRLFHLCPYVDEVDAGTVTIVWRGAGWTIELHSLRTWLDEFAESRISHEEITDLIRHELSILSGIDLVSVETAWNTAGMEVSCFSSVIPAGATL